MTRDKPATWTLVGLLAFVGVGGIGGGLALVVDPSGSLVKLDPGLLTGGPFLDYLVPGILLLSVIGLGHVAGAALVLRGTPGSRYVALALGAGLMVWIAVQLAVIGYWSLLQPIFMGLGLAQCGLAWFLRAPMGDARRGT
jgi:hypothetical protein